VDRDASRRTAQAFRDWATPRLRPGERLPAYDDAAFDVGAATARVAGLLRTNAGSFAAPGPRFRIVDPPPGVPREGDWRGFEEAIRPWLLDGRAYVPTEEKAPVRLFAAAIVLPGPGLGSPPVLRFWCENLADNTLRDLIADALSEDHRTREFARLGIDPGAVARVRAARAEVTGLNPRKAAGEERVGMADTVRQWLPGLFVYLLWVAVFSIAQMLLNSVIEEKSNRIIEVLLSSATPTELMSGKLAGIALVGLVMIGTWITTMFGVLLWFSGGAAGTASPEGVARLPLDIMTLLGDSWILPAFAGYFLLGYVFYSAAILALGSTCDTLKDAQSYMGVIVIVMMVPLVAIPLIPRDPNGALATALSWVPLYTPFIMMNRVTAGPPARDVVGTLLLMLAADAAMIWAAARIFRAALLRTGQPPTPVQLWRWVRGR
jgi:ABC-2 type transport system permease protein